MRFERSVQGVFLRGKEAYSSRGHRTAIPGGTFASPSAGTAPPGVCAARPVWPVSRARDMQVNPASDAIVLARPGPRHSRLGLHGSADPQGLVDILARRGEGRHGRAGPGGRGPEAGAGADPPGSLRSQRSGLALLWTLHAPSKRCANHLACRDSADVIWPTVIATGPVAAHVPSA